MYYPSKQKIRSKEAESRAGMQMGPGQTQLKIKVTQMGKWWCYRTLFGWPKLTWELYMRTWPHTLFGFFWLSPHPPFNYPTVFFSLFSFLILSSISCFLIPIRDSVTYLPNMSHVPTSNFLSLSITGQGVQANLHAPLLIPSRIQLKTCHLCRD